MTDISIRRLFLEFVDANGASHIRELPIEIFRHRSDTAEHTIRAKAPRFPTGTSRRRFVPLGEPPYRAVRSGGVK